MSPTTALRSIVWTSGKLRPPQAGQVQEIFDQLGHPPAGALDPFGVVLAFLAELGPVVLHQGGTEAGQRSQRGSQVMGDRVGEGLQVLVGPLQARPSGTAARLPPGTAR